MASVCVWIAGEAQRGGDRSRRVFCWRDVAWLVTMACGMYIAEDCRRWHWKLSRQSWCLNEPNDVMACLVVHDQMCLMSLVITQRRAHILNRAKLRLTECFYIHYPQSFP